MFRTAIAVFLLSAAPAWAHHSFAAEFDASAPVVLEGKVTKVEWMNPHVYICVDVADNQGRVTNWTVESVAPNYLMRLGWTRKTLRVGDMVVIRAFAAKGQTRPDHREDRHSEKLREERHHHARPTAAPSPPDTRSTQPRRRPAS